MKPVKKDSNVVDNPCDIRVTTKTKSSLEDIWISKISRWTDRKWIFDGKAPGASSNTVTCIWDFELPDGSTLFDPQHSVLLNEARHFFWGIFFDRQDGRRIKTTSAGHRFYALRRLLKWMVQNNYISFGELDSRGSERFCDWLVESYTVPNVDELDDAESCGLDNFEIENTIEDDSSDIDDEKNAACSEGETGNEENLDNSDEITEGRINTALQIWRTLWEQRHSMMKFELGSLQQIPFNGHAVYKVARGLAIKVSMRVPALPDAVAIPLMNAANCFITTYSDDLIKLVHLVRSVRENGSENGQSVNSQNIMLRSIFSGSGFSIKDDSLRRLHEKYRLGVEFSVSELRRLVDDLVAACSISSQSDTGMRIGELTSTLAGRDEKTGLPSCILVRPSKSGLLDLYYIKATLSKMRAEPVKEEWLLAAKPHDINELPDAVRAIIVLQDLLAPFRSMASAEVAKYLFVTFRAPVGFPLSGETVTGPSNRLIRSGQKNFASQYVDWSSIELTEETRPYILTKGLCIRPQQWRKTYAQYVFQVDKRMLPGIARQFKHLSLAVTEGAYVGTSASLVQDVAEFNRNLTTDFFLSNIRGTHAKQEGRLAKLMAEYKTELSRIIDGLNVQDARLAVDTWCRNRDMKIFFHGYGKCIPAIAPTKAECHKRAQTIHWANKEPNYSKREPSVCTGCQLFLADNENVDYWTTRYVENMSIYFEAQALGRGSEYRVAKARADQAKIYLSTLNIELPLVEANDAR